MGKTRAECSQNAYFYTSAFLSHWIQILANSSPKSDIKKKKKKKSRPCFFAFYGRSGEGNITFFGGGLMYWYRTGYSNVHVCVYQTLLTDLTDLILLLPLKCSFSLEDYALCTLSTFALPLRWITEGLHTGKNLSFEWSFQWKITLMMNF